MAGQDPSSMFDMMNLSNPPSSTLDNDDTANQRHHPQPDSTDADTAPSTLAGNDSPSFFTPGSSDWAFETSNGPPAGPYPGQGPSWGNAPQAVSPSSIFPTSMPGGLPSPSQTPAQAQIHNTSHVLNIPAGALTQEQRDALRMIAMPHLPFPPAGSDAHLGSPASNQPGGTSSPERQDILKGNLRKRKSSVEIEEEDDEVDDTQPVKKTSHNMIEKRYRTNLNDKIAALRDSVPSLRIMSKSARGEDTTEDREELHGLTPAHKLNKATVLSKATEYIRHLEKRNNRLQDENHAMQQRIAAFEKLFMAGAMNGTIHPLQHPPPMTYPGRGDQQYMSTSGQGEGTGAGLIQVPEEMKRIIRAQPGQPYAVPHQPYNASPDLGRQQQQQQQQQQQPQDQQPMLNQQGRWQGAAPYTGKLMVGSLAGLM